MKKLSFLLIFVLMIVTIIPYGVAEAFTLHSGVSFGMSTEEVIQNETDAGFTTKPTEYKKKEGGKADSLIMISGSIAGIDNSQIIYSVSNESGLIAATYTFDNSITVIAPEDDSKKALMYKTIQDQLVKVYGEPTNDDHYWLSAAAYIGFEPLCIYPWFDGWYPGGASARLVPDTNYYDAWLLKQDNGKAIVILHWWGKGTMMTNTYEHYLGYQEYEYEDIINGIEKVKEEEKNAEEEEIRKEQEKQNQLENDL